MWQQTGLLESHKVSVTVRRGDPGYWQMSILKHRPARVCVCGGGGYGEDRCFVLSSSTLWQEELEGVC